MRQTLRKLNTRIAALMLAVVLLLSSAPTVSAAQASGTCGDNLSWTLNGDTLTITGSGAMYDYPEETMAPWYAYRKEISTLHLPDGLTRIGDLAFYGCSGLKIVSMPDSVMEVGWFAFAGCSSMTMLNLSSNLKVIEEGGFRECSSLTSVRLPQTLATIGYQGFYRCESLTEITIPAAVKNFGNSAFAFCYDLIRADVQASISKLPDWTFYGCGRLTDVKLAATIKSVGKMAFYDCDSLTNVSYSGTETEREQIVEEIRKDQEEIQNPPHVGDNAQEDTSVNVDYDVNDEDGSIDNTTTTTTRTENVDMSAKLTVTYSNNGQTSSVAHVNVTLKTATAWSEVAAKVVEIVDSVQATYINIYIKDSSTLEKGVFNDLLEKPVIITVHNVTGAIWKIDCRTLGKDANHDLTYERIDATQEQLDSMGCTQGYQIKFLADAQVNAEVMIKLPLDTARRNASLYHKKLLGKQELLQTVVVDDAGYAHFYLAAVDRKTEYLIGIDVPQATEESAIIPEELYQNYGIEDPVSDVEYVVTGRTSSWGMSLNQVTLFLVIGMVTAIVVVGGVMFALNKRKLKNGYIPDLDDEDETE